MDSAEFSAKKAEITKAAWEYILTAGLSGASVGGLCRETKYGESTLYYYFKNKDDIWISAGKYGLSQVIDKLFKFTSEHTASVRKYFDNLLKEIDKYKTELRCVIQMAISTDFGDRMRNAMTDFNRSYADYADKLVKICGCTYEQAEIFIYSMLSAVVDYVVWDDGDKTQLILENLYVRIAKVLHIDEK